MAYAQLYCLKTTVTFTTECGLRGTDSRVSTYEYARVLSQLLTLQNGALFFSQSFVCTYFMGAEETWKFKLNIRYLEQPLELLDHDMACWKVGVRFSAGSDTSLSSIEKLACLFTDINCRQRKITCKLVVSKFDLGFHKFTCMFSVNKMW